MTKQGRGDLGRVVTAPLQGNQNVSVDFLTACCEAAAFLQVPRPMLHMTGILSWSRLIVRGISHNGLCCRNSANLHPHPERAPESLVLSHSTVTADAIARGSEALRPFQSKAAAHLRVRAGPNNSGNLRPLLSATSSPSLTARDRLELVKAVRRDFGPMLASYDFYSLFHTCRAMASQLGVSRRKTLEAGVRIECFNNSVDQQKVLHSDV